MDDISRTLKPWVTFAGCVLVVVVLYWAPAVLVPIALAILLTFVLTPPVTSLQRWIGRIPSCVVTWRLSQISSSVSPAGVWRGRWTIWPRTFRATASTSWRRWRTYGAGKGGSVEKLQETIEDIRPTLTSDGKELDHSPSWSPLRRCPVSELHVVGRSSVRWARPRSCWCWSSSCCSNVEICATGCSSCSGTAGWPDDEGV